MKQDEIIEAAKAAEVEMSDESKFDGGMVYAFNIDQLYEFAQRILDSQPQPTSQDGFVLVPIEPTEEMIKELMRGWDSVGATTMYENYAAMIQSAMKESK